MVPGAIAGYFAAAIVLTLGIAMVIKPDLYLRLLKWQMEYMWAAKFSPSKKTETRVKLMGSFLVLFAAFIVACIYFLD